MDENKIIMAFFKVLSWHVFGGILVAPAKIQI
jgi:hypothetical protein